MNIGSKVKVIKTERSADGRIRNRSVLKKGIIVRATTVGAQVKEPKEVIDLAFTEWFPYQSNVIQILPD